MTRGEDAVVERTMRGSGGLWRNASADSHVMSAAPTKCQTVGAGWVSLFGGSEFAADYPMKIARFVLVMLAPLAAFAANAWKFQFGAAATGRVQVKPEMIYTKEVGYGFEPGATVSLILAANVSFAPETTAITSEQPFSFSVAVPEGNYRVTVTLGAKGDETTTTTVKAETRRLMMERVATKPEKRETRTFMVNVRGPKISTGGEVNLDTRELGTFNNGAGVMVKHWDDKLTLAFSGDHPTVAAIDIEKVDDAVTLFICGDSTVTDQPANGSWGQFAPRWFKNGLAVANHAESGETLKGFLKERRWDKVLDSVKPGDWVLIEFGTNDSKSSGPQNIYPNQDFAETYAPAETTYRELLKKFVADVRAKKANPIIASPSARKGEAAKPTSLAPWAEAAMAVAKELDVPGIDLNSMGATLNAALGADADKQFADRTHHVEYGAYLQAKCIVLGIQQAKLPLAKFITEDFSFDPAKPEPLPGQFDLPPDRVGGRGARGGAASAPKEKEK